MDETKTKGQLHRLNEFEEFLHRLESDLNKLMAISNLNRFNDSETFKKAFVEYDIQRKNCNDAADYDLWKSMRHTLSFVKELQTASDERMLKVIKESMKEDKI